jgi:hypothetical protein
MRTVLENLVSQVFRKPLWANMAEPTLLYCVGATKSGTSWLHRYISNHPECHMRGLKELHYFDAVEFDDWDPWIQMVSDRSARSRREAEGLDEEQTARKLRTATSAEDWREVLLGRRADDAAYLAYLNKGREGQSLVGDFTPAYSLLPEARLRHMAGLLPQVRFIYLMRDPVMRIWSHCRMMARRRANKPEEIQRRSVNIMRRVVKGKEPEIVRRSDYAATLQKLSAVTREGQLYVGIYEELFTRDELRRISHFLGIGLAWADYKKRFMEGPKAEMEPDQWDEMRGFLAEQYDAVAAHFGSLPKASGQRPAD